MISISFWFAHLSFGDIRYVCIFNEDIEHKEKKSNSQFYPCTKFSVQWLQVPQQNHAVSVLWTPALSAFTSCSGKATGWDRLHPKISSNALKPFYHKLIDNPSIPHLRCAESSHSTLFLANFNITFQLVKTVIWSSINENFKEKVGQKKTYIQNSRIKHTGYIHTA